MLSLEPRQVEAMRQGTIHIIITVTPPFVSRPQRVITNNTYGRGTLEADAQFSTPPLGLEVIILGCILMYRVPLRCWVTIDGVLRSYPRQLYAGIAVLPLIDVGIFHVIGNEPLGQHVHEAILVAVLSQDMIEIVGGRRRILQ